MDHTMKSYPESPSHSVPSQSKTATAGSRERTESMKSWGERETLLVDLLMLKREALLRGPSPSCIVGHLSRFCTPGVNQRGIPARLSHLGPIRVHRVDRRRQSR